MLHDVLIRWCEIAPARVVNRVAPMASNFSKPYQAQLIRRYGFLTPETLITNEPELVFDFYQEHRQVIYKSISGVRSIVQQLDESDLPRLPQIRWCPTQFQEKVEGTDVRVHTVGEQLFATAAVTTATDYRYAYRQVGDGADLQPTELPSELTERCIGLAKGLGLAFAGIDLKITPDGQVYCFEVNPSPAFSYYEMNTGQPIAATVARYLAGM
jgi:glutathione synthase/RimK-type ligase-like ATP-grasp enzyme